MKENIPEQNGSSPLENALKQIQTWFVSGDFEKVKKGCEEIINVSPNNSIAQDLLKKAKEALNKQIEKGAETINPALTYEIQTDEPIPASETGAIPTAKIEPEPEPEPPMPEIINDETPFEPIVGSPTEPIPGPPSSDLNEYHKTHSLLINIGILIGLIVIGIGIVYGYNNFFRDKEGQETSNETVEETIAEEIIKEEIEEEIEVEEEIEEEISEDNVSDYEDSIDGRNEKRLSDLSSIENALISYYDTHKKYPSADEINTVLIEEELIDEMPVGAYEGEVYLYAIYDTDLGPSQAYILSAQFENEDGTMDVWTTGAHTGDHPDYDEIEADHVTIIHPTMTETEYLESEIIEVEPEETIEDEEPVRIPRT